MSSTGLPPTRASVIESAAWTVPVTASARAAASGAVRKCRDEGVRKDMVSSFA